MEMLTGRPIAASFDLIAGTSSGGVLAIALGLLRLPISKIEDLYLSLARRVFTPARAVGATVFHAGRLLLLNRGMYDAKALQDIFDSYCGTGRLYEHAAGGGTPRVMVLSTQMKGEGVRGPRVFLHTNYRHVGERYAHGCLHKVADALRATTAAPVYFDVFHDGDGGSFCDGAVLMNNPAAVAVHEARALWPGRELGVVVSVGTGLVAEGLEVEGKVMEGNGDGKVGGDKKERSMVLKVARAVLDSATDTEAVHHTLQDLLHQPDVYFRLNAELQHEVRLDEYRAAVLERMREIGAAYCSDNASGGRIIRRLCAKLAVGGRGGLWGKLGEAYARL